MLALSYFTDAEAPLLLHGISIPASTVSQRLDREADAPGRNPVAASPSQAAAATTTRKSGIFVEARFALALGRPPVYFVRDRQVLPYILPIRWTT